MELRGRAAGNAASPERMLFGGRLGVVVVHAFRSFGLFKGLGAFTEGMTGWETTCL